MPAVSSSPTLCIVDDSDPLLGELADVPAVPGGLLDVISRVPDPRKPRGKRHGLAGILGIALAATLAGARSSVAIAEWVADIAPASLAALGVTGAPPCESTIRRCLQRLAADDFDALISQWMWLHTHTGGGRRVIAFDGKTLRGARDGAGRLTHLLAGLCQGTGTVLAQLAVNGKTNEIPMLRALLGGIDITGVVITAGALHCQRETAEAITTAGGHYILTVKANQPHLRTRLKALPWNQIPVCARSTEHRRHGRSTTRTLKAASIADGIGFPGAEQVLKMIRTVTCTKTGKRYTETVYAITSLSVTDATPSEVADWLRGHWDIENRLHWVRDVTYGEDHSQIRVGAGPQVTATLRNIAISLLRLHHHDNIAKALRHNARHPHRAIKLLLTS